MGMWERYGVPPDMGYGDRSIFLEDTGEDGSGGDWTSTACASCC